MGSHTPVSLVKFLSAERGLTALKEGALCWYAPHMFKDPFEASYQTDLGFDQAQFTKALIKRISAMLFLRDDPEGSMTPIKKAVKRWRVEQRFRSEDEAEEALVHLLPTMVGNHFNDIQAQYDRWRLYAYNARLVCLSDNINDVDLWQHAADHHRGFAIRFKVGPDHCFSKPHKVNYRSARVKLLSLDEELDRFISGVNVEQDKDLEGRLLSKSKHYAQQREWRCIARAQRPSQPDSQATSRGAIEIKPFEAEAVMAVYFGLNMPQETTREVLALLEQRYPKAKLYLAKLSDHSYEMEFVQTDPEAFKLDAG